MKRKRILIIDDERLTRISLADFLEDAGYQVMTAEDGESAIQISQMQRFDVCIVDIRMPGMDGVEVIQYLHSINEDSLFIICTGSPQFVVPLVLRKLGVQQCNVVLKPILDMAIFTPLIEQDSAPTSPDVARELDV